MNFNELLATGVFTKTLDEDMVHLWMRGTLIHDWHAAKDYICQAREDTDNPRIYLPFQLLAEAWESGQFPVLKNGQNGIVARALGKQPPSSDNRVAEGD